MRNGLLIILLSLPLTLFATTQDIYHFQTPAQQQQFQNLLTQFRCLVCQNQDLADSNAKLALDLKSQIHHMVSEHWTDEAITDYLTARYGDFVLFTPPLTTRTYLLWFAPGVMLIMAMLSLLWLIWRRQSNRDMTAS